MPGQREPVSQRWWRDFPGDPQQLRVLREWLRGLLPDCPARDDVIVVAHELGANAVCHTASGQGGQFSVEVTMVGAVARIVVGDCGGPGKPRLIDDPDSENGRGLRVVQGLTTIMLVGGDEHGRFVRADVPWTANGGPDLNRCGWDREVAAASKSSWPAEPVRRAMA